MEYNHEIFNQPTKEFFCNLPHWSVAHTHEIFNQQERQVSKPPPARQAVYTSIQPAHAIPPAATHQSYSNSANHVCRATQNPTNHICRCRIRACLHEVFVVAHFPALPAQLQPVGHLQLALPVQDCNASCDAVNAAYHIPHHLQPSSCSTSSFSCYF